jgi:hypothetical protein
MMEILEKDISSIRSIMLKAANSFSKFEKLILYLESEVQRTRAKDIRSVAQDIVAIQKLANESKTC